MRRRRGRLRHTIALLIALLLVPLVARGAHHAHDTSTARPCAVCTAVKHTPSLTPAPLETPAPLFVRTAFETSTPAAAAVSDHPLHGGRAPPSSATARTA